jgi:hypothetical protein
MTVGAHFVRRGTAVLAVLVLILGFGCRRGDRVVKADSPKEAASYLDQTFEQARPEVKEAAAAASAALRAGQYEKAVVSLETVQGAKDITLDQGLAVHSSMIVLERDLIAAIQAGDANAKRVYALLRQLKRQ